MARRRATPGSRLSVLHDIIDHLFSAQFHLELRLRAGAPVRSLWPSLRLAKFRMTQGSYKSRILCESDTTFDEARRHVHASVIKEVTWDREGDRERARKRIVRWPKMRVAYYRVPHTALQDIRAAMPQLDLAISLLLDTERAERVEPVATWRGGSYRREVIHDDHYGLRVRWTEPWAPPSVNKAWEQAWETLGAACLAEHSIVSCRDVYDVAPRRVAELRVSELK